MKSEKRAITGLFLVAAMLLTSIVAYPVINVQAAEDTEYIHILYRDKAGQLKVVWKFEVTRDKETEVSADLMKDYDASGIIGSIDDLKDIKGIIALKYRPDRDGDSAPSDLEAFMKKLSKEDTFQTGKPYGKDKQDMARNHSLICCR